MNNYSQPYGEQVKNNNQEQNIQQPPFQEQPMQSYQQQYQQQQQFQPQQLQYNQQPQYQQIYPVQQPYQQGYAEPQVNMNQQQQYPMIIVPQQQYQQQALIGNQNLNKGPVQIKCFQCNQLGVSMVQRDSCNVYACGWFCICGFVGLFSYLFCCEEAHGYKHYCLNCGALNHTKEAQCVPEN